LNEFVKPPPNGGGFFLPLYLKSLITMKKIVFFTLILAGLASCQNATDVPQLELTLSKEIKKNTELSTFIMQAKDNANELARGCVEMHEKAQQYLTVNFDSLDTAQQEQLVKLDYEYVEMWYKFNVKFTEQTVQLMEYLKDESIPKEELIEMGKSIAQVNTFVQELKDTYGQDLKLDPYPAPVQ